jgi:hypothetical protein
MNGRLPDEEDLISTLFSVVLETEDGVVPQKETDNFVLELAPPSSGKEPYLRAACMEPVKSKRMEVALALYARHKAQLNEAKLMKAKGIIALLFVLPMRNFLFRVGVENSAQTLVYAFHTTSHASFGEALIFPWHTHGPSILKIVQSIRDTLKQGDEPKKEVGHGHSKSDATEINGSFRYTLPQPATRVTFPLFKPEAMKEKLAAEARWTPLFSSTEKKVDAFSPWTCQLHGTEPPAFRFVR